MKQCFKNKSDQIPSIVYRFLFERMMRMTNASNLRLVNEATDFMYNIVSEFSPRNDKNDGVNVERFLNDFEMTKDVQYDRESPFYANLISYKLQ